MRFRARWLPTKRLGAAPFKRRTRDDAGEHEYGNTSTSRRTSPGREPRQGRMQERAIIAIRTDGREQDQESPRRSPHARGPGNRRWRQLALATTTTRLGLGAAPECRRTGRGLPDRTSRRGGRRRAVFLLNSTPATNSAAGQCEPPDHFCFRIFGGRSPARSLSGRRPRRSRRSASSGAWRRGCRV